MPSKEEINKTIHEFMAPHSHVFVSRKTGRDACWNCGQLLSNSAEPCFPKTNPPDYTSSDSPRRLLEEVVAKIREEKKVSFVRELVNVTPFVPSLLVGLSTEKIARTCFQTIKESQ